MNVPILEMQTEEVILSTHVQQHALPSQTRV